MTRYVVNCFLFPVLHLISGINAFGQDRYFGIVDKCLDKRTHFESVFYDMELEHKYFSEEDTLRQVAKVELVRIPDDTLFGGLCRIDMDSIWFGYDGTSIIKGLPQIGTIEMANAEQNPGLYIQSTWIDNFMDYGFLKLSYGLKDYLLDESSQARFLDTLIGEWPCLGIYFKLPDQNEIYDQTFFIAIDTIEYYIRSRMYSAYFQENHQYTIWNYRQVQYGHKLHIDKLDASNFSKFNTVIEHKSDTSELIPALDFDFKVLTGSTLMKSEVFKISEVHSKFIILDFWYTSCYPCIKSIPSVNKIYQAYKDKNVLVYGINAIDDTTKDKARIDKFLKNNPMGYETIMVDKEIGSAVCAEGYPTFIILDQNYNVVYKETGYKENLYQEVSAFLEEALSHTK